MTTIALLVACGGKATRERDAGAAGTGNSSSGTGAAGGSGIGGTAGDANAGESGAGESASGGVSAAAGESGNGGAPSIAGGGSTQAGGGGRAGGSAGDGGSGAIAGGNAAPAPCNSSDGTGCDSSSYCVDDESDGCWPGVYEEPGPCGGFCARRAAPAICAGLGVPTPCPDGYVCAPEPRSASGTDPIGFCVESAATCATSKDCPSGFSCVPSGKGSVCSPELVNCAGATCPAKPLSECPVGFLRSTPDGCYGPCVPAHRCACESDWSCGGFPASCDRSEGRCAAPAAPAPRCLAPIEAGTCEEPWQHFAFVDQRCQPVEGVTCAADNVFDSLEECRSYCEGQPGEEPCPEGTQAAVICVMCGDGGGCSRSGTVCARPCETDADCEGSVGWCYDGICQVAGCV